MKVRQAVVMVGGMGTRLRPLTENKPKPMLSVADKPCIWYLMRSLARAGIEEVILACGYKPGMMESLGDGSDLGIKIVYSYEEQCGCLGKEADCAFLQGEAMGRPSVVTTRIQADGNIFVGGTAVVVAEGTLMID